jgi:phosphate transport system protein
MTIRHFELELAELKRALVTMGSLVERSVGLATESIRNPVPEAREKARVIEDQLDTLESAIEERCQQIIALQAPMASDLRLVIAAMRITADLEQVGDNAESIAKRASWIARHALVTNPAALSSLCDVAYGMIRNALSSFLNGDGVTVRMVIADEDRADDLTKVCYEEIQRSMVANPERIREYTHLLRAVAHLENIADHAVSIAEEGVYIRSGRLVRHDHEHIPA